MKWSKEINKTFGANSAHYYPKHKAVAIPGFLRDEPVWIATIALHNHDEGHHCPYCNGEEDYTEELNSVRFEGYENGHDILPYINTECKCKKCGKWWTIRSKPSTAECVIDFTPPRNPCASDPYGHTL